MQCRQVNKFRIIFSSVLDYLEAWWNLLLFYPYFFSVLPLLKTIFYPWKGLVYQKKTPGFSLNTWLEEFSFNMISSAIGFFLRLSLIIFCFVLMIIHLLFFPFGLVLSFFLTPFSWFKNLFFPSPSLRKNYYRKVFISKHLTNLKNYQEVNQWFEIFFNKYINKPSFWKKDQLFLIPPLARDWAFGFTYYLNQYSLELTSGFYLDRRPPLIDREKEIAEIESTLSESYRNNVIIVGNEGVGKHAIVDGLAFRLYYGLTNKKLMYKRLLKLDLEKIVTQAKDQKEREFFFEQLLKEAMSAGNVILFIDKIDRYLSNEEGRVDLSLPIEKYAQTDKIQFIGICTPFEYQKYFAVHDKLKQIFQLVKAEEVTKETAKEILLNSALQIETNYNVIIPYEVVLEIIDLSDFLVSEVPFPEKAINLLDEIVNQSLKRNSKISPEFVREYLSEKTGIPILITQDLKNKLAQLEQKLNQRIIGQKHATNQVTYLISRNFLLKRPKNKPLGSMLLIGPTGVGKTETAKVVAELFFGSENYLHRFDMSEYQNLSDVEKLIGNPLTKDPGLLTSTIRHKPYGVLLLDEIEKAHPKILNLFLTILDEGYFFDSFGRKIDCRHLFIFATSNAGSDILYQNQSKITQEQLIDILIEKKYFSPEFINRFDGVVLYQFLNHDQLVYLAYQVMNEINQNQANLPPVYLSSDEISQIIKEKVDPRFGARNLKRVIREIIEKEMIKKILNSGK